MGKASRKRHTSHSKAVQTTAHVHQASIPVSPTVSGVLREKTKLTEPKGHSDRVFDMEFAPITCGCDQVASASQVSTLYSALYCNLVLRAGRYIEGDFSRS